MAHDPSHDLSTPSPWVVRWAPLIKTGGAVLDVACGRGRHARYLAGLGHEVTAVDRDPEALESLRGIPRIHTLHADLENNQPWPLPGKQFDGIVVTNYLHRPLFPHLIASLAQGGVLIYETFALGNERYGKPSNPDFLLRPGELLKAFGSMHVEGFEEGLQQHPKPSQIQRICAIKAASGFI
jgi:SAM-dependent methyltransferase